MWGVLGADAHSVSIPAAVVVVPTAVVMIPAAVVIVPVAVVLVIAVVPTAVPVSGELTSQSAVREVHRVDVHVVPRRVREDRIEEIGSHRDATARGAGRIWR